MTTCSIRALVLILLAAISFSERRAFAKDETGRESRSLSGLGAPATDLLFLPKSDLLAVAAAMAGNVGEAGVIDTSSGKIVWRQSVPAWRIALGKKGTLLMTNNGGLINIHEAKNGKRQAHLVARTGGAPSFLAADPRGRWIYSADLVGNVLRSRFTEGSSIGSMGGKMIELQSGGKVKAIALNAKGTVLAAAGENKAILLVKPEAAKVVKAVKSPTDEITDLAFNAAGSLLAVASVDKTIALLSASSGKQKHRLEGHESPVRRVAFPGKGTLVVSGSEDGSVILWETKKGTRVATLAVPARRSKGVAALAFSSDGKVVAAAVDEEIRLWDVGSVKR